MLTDSNLVPACHHSVILLCPSLIGKKILVLEQKIDERESSTSRHVHPSEEALGEAVQGENPLGCRLEEKNALETRGEEFNFKGKKSLIIPGSWSQRLVFIV